jgi:hypothetical protein
MPLICSAVFVGVSIYGIADHVNWGNFVFGMVFTAGIWPISYYYWKHIVFQCPGCHKDEPLSGKQCYCSLCGTKIRELAVKGK